ncbi:hypothetical protein N2599_13665 [Rhizobium sullae]|nr:hypothetical protein [Rhizobium sullae]UWU13198.1 hypothetical protein N2599_13665 [Rhizobium sullae]
MYYSLSATPDEPRSDMDMRDRWRDGTSIADFPNFFNPVDAEIIEDLPVPGDGLKNLLDEAVTQGLRAYRYILAQTPGFAVVKITMSKMAVTDPTFYANNDRFKQFASLTGFELGEITYTHSMFM